MSRSKWDGVVRWWLIVGILVSAFRGATVLAGAPASQQVIPFDEGMESEQVRASGGCNGALCQFWQRVSTQAHSGSFSIFGIDRAESGYSNWEPFPSFAIPADATAASLTFWQRFGFERNGQFAYDGGVLEIALDDSGDWTDAGARITTGGYNGTILLNEDSGNPLGGRAGWVGASDGWQQVIVDLMPYRGQPFRLRWQLGTDNSNASEVEGWWVDEVQVSYRAPLTSCDRGWMSGSPYPSSASRPAVAAIERTLYAFGGRTDNGETALSYKYSVDSDTWAPIAALPEPRVGASAVSDGRSIYIVGGGRGSTGTKTLWRYNPESNSYSTLAAASTATAYHGAAYLDGKIYRIGGRTDLSEAREFLNTVEIYDVASNSWTSGPAYPQQRASIAAVAADGYVFAGGGVSYITSTLKTYRYDPDAEVWDDGPIADLPTSGDAYGTLYRDQWILFITGLPYSWNRQTNGWRSLDQIPETVGNAAIAAAGGLVQVVSPTLDQSTSLQQYGETLCTDQCLGDCGNDGNVAVSDLVRGVAIALTQQPLSACPSFDDNDDGRVAVNELVAAVGNALRGCP